MKNKLILLSLIALAFLISEGQGFSQSIIGYQKLYVQGNITNTVPRRLSTTNLWVSSATFIGKTTSRSNNLGIVYIDIVGTNTTLIDDNLQAFDVPIGATSPVVILAGPDKLFNLKDWQLDVLTNNDGLIIYYK